MHNDTTPPQPNHTVTPTHIELEQYNTWNKYTISRKLLRIDILTFETYWAVNSEIIKRVTSSWSIFILLWNVMIIRPVGVCLLHVDGQTDRQIDRQDEVYSSYSLCERAKKNGDLLHKITRKHDKTQNHRTYSVFIQRYELWASVVGFRFKQESIVAKQPHKQSRKKLSMPYVHNTQKTPHSYYMLIIWAIAIKSWCNKVFTLTYSLHSAESFLRS